VYFNDPTIVVKWVVYKAIKMNTNLSSRFSLLKSILLFMGSAAFDFCFCAFPHEGGHLIANEGWELVHMRPVYVGSNADVLIHGLNERMWSSAYFCVFKRPRD
jgi:hypothetical protein